MGSMRRELNALTYPQTAAHISIGWAMVDITPDRPVQLMGQYYERVSEGVRDPLTATALALDSGREQAVIVSCDLIDAPQAVQERVRLRLASRLPGLDVAAVLMAATHTHTAPVLEDGWYPTPAADLMRTEEYVDFLVERLVDVVVEAWDAREPGGVSWGLARAVVGHNRRVLYADGAAQMYGRTDVPSFSGIEGGRDDGVELLYTWDSGGGLTGAAINVACPSQAAAHLSVVSADFWGEARQQLPDRWAQPRLLGDPGGWGEHRRRPDRPRLHQPHLDDRRLPGCVLAAAPGHPGLLGRRTESFGGSPLWRFLRLRARYHPRVGIAADVDVGPRRARSERLQLLAADALQPCGTHRRSQRGGQSVQSLLLCGLRAAHAAARGGALLPRHVAEGEPMPGLGRQ